MEAVIFDGKEYIKASVVAERFKYTQDYIGQLCRGKKVDARLVGRAWYINLESLHNHKKARYKATDKKTEVAPIQDPQQKYLSRVDVEPVLKKKTVKILRNNTENRLTEFPVKYETDDFSLIPHINRQSVSESIPILPAESESLTVKTPKEAIKITNFHPEPLPEVYLKGVLRVDGIPEVVEGDEEQDNNLLAEADNREATKDPELLHVHTQATEGLIEAKKPIKIRLYKENESTPPQSREKVQALSSERTHLAEIKSTHAGAKTASPKPLMLPKRAVVRQRAVFGEPVVTKEVVEIPNATIKAILLFLALAVVAGGILFVVSDVAVISGSAVTTWDFSPELLVKIWSAVTVW